jgi:hypothetical protein
MSDAQMFGPAYGLYLYAFANSSLPVDGDGHSQGIKQASKQRDCCCLGRVRVPQTRSIDHL